MNTKLPINKIKLTNFRKFENLELSIKKNITILCGNNALGKTTILEAIYVAGITKSHKTNNDLDLINNDQEYAKVEIDDKYKVIISKEGKKTLINNVEKKRLSDYIGNLYVIMFSPEDLNIIKGSPSLRRRMMDIEIGQVNKKYLFELNKYRHLLKERNELLKSNDIDMNYLNIITDEIIISNTIIMNFRKEFINDCLSNAKKIHYEIANEELDISYCPSITETNLTSFFKSKIKSDVFNKVTGYGIHRDDIAFTVNGVKSNLLSQGQMRSIILSFKLSLINYIKEKTGVDAIILLDDVFSELDDTRCNKLMSCIKNNQTFITSTNIFAIGKMDYQLFMFTKEKIKELD